MDHYILSSCDKVDGCTYPNRDTDELNASTTSQILYSITIEYGLINVLLKFKLIIVLIQKCMTSTSVSVIITNNNKLSCVII